MASQKENNNSIATKFRDMKYDLRDKKIQNSCQEGIQQAIRKLRKNSMKSEIMLINRRWSSPQKLKL